MRVVTAQIPDELADALDQLLQKEGRSKSWLIREALTEYLAHQRELERLTLEGLEAVREGRIVSHEEVGNELDKWGM